MTPSLDFLMIIFYVYSSATIKVDFRVNYLYIAIRDKIEPMSNILLEKLFTVKSVLHKYYIIWEKLLAKVPFEPHHPTRLSSM